MVVTNKSFPRVEIGPDGKPLFIEPISEDVLKLLRPSNASDVDMLYQYRTIYRFDTPTQIREAKKQYLSRFNLTPEQPGYERAFNQLSEEVNANKVLVANARRTSQRMQLIEATGGNSEKEVIYINDNDDPDAICPNCLSLGGEQHPVSWFVANNAQPGDRCLGGDNCLCILVPID